MINDDGSESDRAAILGDMYEENQAKFVSNVSERREGPDSAPADVSLWINVTRKWRDPDAGLLGDRERMSSLLSKRVVEAENS
ncbi:hypothetical protein HPB50_002606 [Hyalomma asiaticum]|uniref:Uncharacterized protein n=1 Tax=Hyalomma asiaticum TaxID=266040 RepID=A0ACB7TBI1_HYAAI|nr:hypothetical protein HPB50_002606 [Hyalomma asiaticum]